jgi:hypothetical protein
VSSANPAAKPNCESRCFQLVADGDRGLHANVVGKARLELPGLERFRAGERVAPGKAGLHIEEPAVLEDNDLTGGRNLGNRVAMLRQAHVREHLQQRGPGRRPGGKGQQTREQHVTARARPERKPGQRRRGGRYVRPGVGGGEEPERHLAVFECKARHVRIEEVRLLVPAQHLQTG